MCPRSALLRSAHLERRAGAEAESSPRMEGADSGAGQDSARGDGGQVLLFAGECFSSASVANEELGPRASVDTDLLHRYETLGPSFIADLNGLFSGLLIDPRRRRALLFNDRYGSEWLY